ncbi:MAG: UDP-N-acetylmuramoyl-L-alanine--D-glutamate ligase [Clostridiales bacterium]|nr:UDP-N-acetylmuramoyl-L-alanine--D-glutamate ligase [Clostridiales bacterium]
MSKLTEFYSYINNKTVSVVGIGISNTPLIDFLLGHGAVVTARDIKPREKLGVLADELEAKGVKLVLGDGYLADITDDIIFKAPGIRCDMPEFTAAVAGGSRLTSEMELFFELCPCKIFAVTGSDGKTTTTTLTYTLLRRELEKRGSNAKVHVGGNIGKPLLPEIESIQPDDFAVLELSSFQLHTMRQSPYAAAITNVTPNHLNWHTDMDEYIRSKENIFLYPGNERLVLNWGNDVTRDMYSLTKADITYFSAKCEPSLENASAAIYDRGGVIVRKTADSVEEILPISDIKLPGRHNVENYMTAIALTYGFVSREVICEVAREFGGVEHRCEFVRELDGVKYYNSSIDSSPTRTEAALRSFSQKVIVICGGYDKHIPYEPLAKPLIDCAKSVVLVGATSPKIKAALLSSPEYAGSPDIIGCDTFESAVEAARGAAKSGDIVILSPASASFDMFPNFEVRGNRFKEIVNSLK